MQDAKVNLFVYGSLRDPEIFESVSGLAFTRDPDNVDHENLYAAPALLAGYKKVSPDNVYFYAVKTPASKINGFIIYGISAEAMAEIDRYEGKRYDKETVRVNTAKGITKAQAYLASHEKMKKYFGDRFHVNLIHELWLRKRIEQFIESHTRPGEDTEDASLERKAQRELLATTERDLVISHYRTDAVSDYFLAHELDRPRPTIKHLYDDPEASAYIDNYLALVIKQILLNQLEDKIQVRYRFELEHMRTSERYFKRSISLLVALAIMNANSQTVELITDQALETISFPDHDLIDYIKYAIHATDCLFDTRVIRSHLDRIRSNFQPGLIPLGAEIELSNIGSAVVQPQMGIQKKTDPVYDGFKYFHDFGLSVMTWKLGGYIDDHTDSNEGSRRPGFLELAPGRLNIARELSRPVTADPWLLNQLIHEITNFYKVLPHSLHLSFQLRKNQIGRQKILPLGFVKCLLVLGGGLQRKNTGRLWVSRIVDGEITQHDYGEELVFARTSKRNWFVGDDEIAEKTPAHTTALVHQYKFIRLDSRANYEPLIMCLKGLQLACNPADYLSTEQLSKSLKLRRDYEHLKQWSAEPEEIAPSTIARFIKAVNTGLMNERHNRPAHKLYYIDWALSAVDVQLRMFNKQFKQPPRDS